MLIKKKNLKSFIRQYLSEQVLSWHGSLDQDYPSSKNPLNSLNLFPGGLSAIKSDRVLYLKAAGKTKEFINFNKYTLIDNTHARLSHFLKHFMEFDSSSFITMIQSIRQQIQSDFTNNLIEIRYSAFGNRAIKINNLEDLKSTYQVAAGEVAVETGITLGDVLNTLDRINDDLYEESISGSKLISSYENSLLAMHVLPMVSNYDKIINDIIEKSVDVSNTSFSDVNQLISFLNNNPTIKFQGFSEGHNYIYYYDIASTALVALTAKGHVKTCYKPNFDPSAGKSTKASLMLIAGGKATKINPNGPYSNLYSAIDKIVSSKF